jgi:hypothetical protein
MVERQPAPTIFEIAQANASDQVYFHWYAFLAGMDLLWENGRDLGALTGETLTAAFALSLVLDTFDDVGRHFPGTAREWSRSILRDRPDIAEQACSTLLTERLRQRKDTGNLLHRLPDPAAAPWRSKLAVELLGNYEITNSSNLEQLCLMAAESVAGREQLAGIAEQRVFAPSANRSAEDRFWIVVGFALVGERFERKLATTATSDTDTLWITRALTQASAQTDRLTGRIELSVRQMEFMVRTFGPIFPNTERASGIWGDRSDADAALYLGGLVTAMSTRPDPEAGECLARLLGCQELMSYRPWISGRLAEQRELNRQSRYEKPSWDAVCAALQGGAPADIQDLKALFLASLADAAQDIRGSNLDKYRVYWSGGRAGLGAPRDEEYCRDRLVEYLRERLKPCGLSLRATWLPISGLTWWCSGRMP